MTDLEIRPIEPGDKAALAAAVDQSRSCLPPLPEPARAVTAAELRYLTKVDHRDHAALLAVVPGGSKSVGVTG